MDPFFLGIDCSTQSLTGIIINFENNEVIFKESLNYDKDFPEYKTKNGVIYSEDENIVHSNPLMWVDALEQLLKKINNQGFLLSHVKAISGSAQQHGTVYVSSSFEKIIKNLEITKKLSSQIKSTLTRTTSPIWMDSSTSAQCKEIRENLGGKENVIQITGSNTYERFSGPQIRKFYQENPMEYQRTSKIHLISSFLASILIGKNAPIDYSDGTGMNLMNIKEKSWDNKALIATAPDLRQKLPQLISSVEVIGKISKFFCKKYNFAPNVKIIAWSGDNPDSLIGTGLIEKSNFAISLGTSDTFFGYLTDLSFNFNEEGHIFRAPTGDFMSLLCFKNGSLARERMKDIFNLRWSEVSKILNDTLPGNEGKIILPYFFPEIVPLVQKPKIYRFGLDEKDVKGNIRGIIEAQFLSMRLHSIWINERPRKIIATGGASENKEILQVIANIFQAPVERFEILDSAALGAALRAAFSFFKSQGIQYTWREITNKLLERYTTKKILPDTKTKKLYKDMVILYKEYENFILKNGPNPEEKRQNFMVKYFQ
ncbi:MAG: FGGY family carbohydrate kinase [Candidatus Lokiarchaeota archaeon]